MRVLRALAPAKVNLGLFLGPPRPEDSRHELVTVMQSISLADELTLEPASPGAAGDEVLCPGVPGENLAAAALMAFRRSTGWSAPPVRLRIDKRIPVAAGLGGGSADAAAALRLAAHASGLGDTELLLELAASLGADVPAQVVPGRWLAGGAGERLQALPEPGTPFGLLVLAATEGLSTASVFAEADRLGLVRGRAQLEERRHEIAAALAHGLPLPAARDLLHNDLQRAAVSLRPAIVEALGQARAAGAETVLVSGSGPTVLGLFTRGVGTEAGVERARLAAVGMRGREPEALSAEPVGADFARVEAIATS